jgi:hypothetical protein
MSPRFPLLRSLDPYHQRLGYLNCVLLCAQASLDSRESVVARFHDYVFSRVDEGSSLWEALVPDINERSLQQLHKASQEARRNDPTSILVKDTPGSQWAYLHELWLHSQRVYSAVGAIRNEEDKIARPVELARWLGLLLPTYNVSDTGHVLRVFIDGLRTKQGDAFNPFVVRGVPQMAIGYLRAFLEADCLMPILLNVLVDEMANGGVSTRGERGLLRLSVGRLLATTGEATRPDEIADYQQLGIFRDSVTKNLSTEENYLRPRMEILVDLGIVDRHDSAKSTAFPWVVTDVTRRAASELAGLAALSERREEYLDGRFFESAGTIYGQPLVSTPELTGLRAFGRAFAVVGREFGFTPARAVALAACMDEWASGRRWELDQILAIVKDAAHTALGKYLHFSGGSRLNEDFLIRVDPAISTQVDDATVGGHAGPFGC